MKPINRGLASLAFVLLVATGSTRADEYVQTNLISNISGLAQVTDPNLQGAWGMSDTTSSPWWVSNQASDTATLYKVNVTPPVVMGLVVGIPNQGGVAPDPGSNGPTGQVATGALGITTGSTDFLLNGTKASFIFSNIDGSISAWNGGTAATITATVSGASYTGMAIGNLPGAGGAAQLYAADQNSGNIDVFNNKWQNTGTFTQPTALPAGYAAFNVQNLLVNGTQTLFVTFANQSTGGGIVDEFGTDGSFIKTLVNDTAGAHLNAPWGLAIAPAGWGQFGGDLLVANNNADASGVTGINAYDPTTGNFVGELTLSNGQAFSETELWAISFGNGGSAGPTNTLYFTAGLDGNTNGLFGSIQSVPEPSSAVLGLIAAALAAGAWRWKNRRRTAG